MTILANVPDAADYALLAGFVISTYRRKKRWHDAWWFAFGLLTLDIIRAIVDPWPDIPARIGTAVTIGLWLWACVHWWPKSGIPCRAHGHVWMVSIKTPEGYMQMSLPSDPAAEAAAFAKLTPQLLGQGWAHAAIVTRSCAVCNASPKLDPEPPPSEEIP